MTTLRIADADESTTESATGSAPTPANGTLVELMADVLELLSEQATRLELIEAELRRLRLRPGPYVPSGIGDRPWVRFERGGWRPYGPDGTPLGPVFVGWADAWESIGVAVPDMAEAGAGGEGHASGADAPGTFADTDAALVESMPPAEYDPLHRSRELPGGED